MTLAEFVEARLGEDVVLAERQLTALGHTDFPHIDPAVARELPPDMLLDYASEHAGHPDYDEAWRQ